MSSVPADSEPPPRAGRPGTKEEAGALLQKKVIKVRAENSGTDRSCFYDDLNIILSPTTAAEFKAEAEHGIE